MLFIWAEGVVRYLTLLEIVKCSDPIDLNNL